MMEDKERIFNLLCIYTCESDIEKRWSLQRTRLKNVIVIAILMKCIGNGVDYDVLYFLSYMHTVFHVWFQCFFTFLIFFFYHLGYALELSTTCICST